VEPPTPPEPDLAPGVGDLLESAEDIINAAGPEIVAEEERRRIYQERQPWWQKLRRGSRRRY
jgi:hypothetical protein